jgi:hypothetical protein
VERKILLDNLTKHKGFIYMTFCIIMLHYAECNAERHILFIVTLNVIMLSVAMLSIILLSLIMLSVVMLNVAMLSVLMLSVLMLSVLMLSVVMLNVAVLSVLMLSVFTLEVVMLSILAPFKTVLFTRSTELRLASRALPQQSAPSLFYFK